ncbi:uncharacterized protein MYCFIDRAFT_175056 [Pseudocercospora fijiensis CIRAD86]|uniref:Uncharacterized protein n=1 Tax=Pseudocercospora fijiensis (strain CIRAD86) TaxID=383855 RepID=M2ZXB3_PSEFD|nr:uncharacterized protein MYCFIDRAFT_175056 [Pseudocercospora fijiensis CIRAD86]EME83629.1 hypothetical protein MYCFIDRAFT_175056 [Pseudocercospora fijiensis CIRAD86]
MLVEYNARDSAGALLKFFKTHLPICSRLCFPKLSGSNYGRRLIPRVRVLDSAKTGRTSLFELKIKLKDRNPYILSPSNSPSWYRNPEPQRVYDSLPLIDQNRRHTYLFRPGDVTYTRMLLCHSKRHARLNDFHGPLRGQRLKSSIEIQQDFYNTIASLEVGALDTKYQHPALVYRLEYYVPLPIPNTYTFSHF